MFIELLSRYTVFLSASISLTLCIMHFVTIFVTIVKQSAPAAAYTGDPAFYDEHKTEARWRKTRVL